MDVFPVRRESYSYGAAFQLFIEGAEMAQAPAGAGAAYARAVALFDGNNAEELAAARAQWKELKDLGFAPTYWQQGAGAGKRNPEPAPKFYSWINLNFGL
jgi:DNA polymerase III subunit chi